MSLLASLLGLLLGVALAQECPQFCTREYNPVCGSNWKTYGNRCLLEVEACTTKSGVTVQQEGACVCRTACAKIYQPVCGSDGKTYGNPCSLNAESCTKRSGLTIAHQGACVEAATNAPCLMICPRIYLPVCGSDGVTYSNECVMRSRACSTNKVITTVRNGECDA